MNIGFKVIDNTNLEEVPRRLKNNLYKKMLQATTYMQGETKRGAPRKTGRFSRSINRAMRMLSGRYTGIVGTDVKYAEALERGTGIHGPKGQPIVIRPRAARALMFPVQPGMTTRSGRLTSKTQRALAGGDASGFAFAKRVTIKGMKPKHVFKNAMERGRPRVIKYLDEGVGEAIR